MVPNSQDLLAKAAAERAPAGRLAARYLLALVRAKGRREKAQRIIENSRWADKHVLMKQVSAISTDGAPGLLNEVAASFFARVFPQTLAARMTSLRRVPFQRKSITPTSGPTAQWVKEGGAIGAGAYTFSTSNGLPQRKIASLSIITDELAKDSDAEGLILNDIANACIAGLDDAFIDPDSAGVPDEKPQSIANAGEDVASSGDFRDDFQRLFEAFDGDLLTAFIAMHPDTAIALSLQDTPLGSANLGANGGQLFGIPVLTSSAVPVTSSGSSISLIDAAGIEFAADPSATELSVSTEASIEMLTDPSGSSSDPTATQLVSLWQTNAVGLLGILRANWRIARPCSVATLTGVDYTFGGSG